MINQHIFNFKSELSDLKIPKELNNPFSDKIPEISKVAAKEFQSFIELESENWNFDIQRQRGKMFGVLVVQKDDKDYGYLGTVSGKLPGGMSCIRFVPSVFDDSVDDFFMNRGMTKLTAMGNQIKNAKDPAEAAKLKEKRTRHSIGLQKKLFENYRFLNISGAEKNLIQIFKESSHGNPPSAAGECAAPKLLQYAFKSGLKPVAIAEFWWGNPGEDKGKKHNAFYPACKDRCRPILEYMLQDSDLFNSVNAAP